jgi:hypothetical protein
MLNFGRGCLRSLSAAREQGEPRLTGKCSGRPGPRSRASMLSTLPGMLVVLDIRA